MPHEFTLVLDVPRVTQALEDALFAAGCDDGTIVQRDGLVTVEFDRKAPTLWDAIVSAIRAVRSAGATVAGVEGCDPVVAQLALAGA